MFDLTTPVVDIVAGEARDVEVVEGIVSWRRVGVPGAIERVVVAMLEILRQRGGGGGGGERMVVLLQLRPARALLHAAAGPMMVQEEPRRVVLDVDEEEEAFLKLVGGVRARFLRVIPGGNSDPVPGIEADDQLAQESLTVFVPHLSKVVEKLRLIHSRSPCSHRTFHHSQRQLLDCPA